jgi:hypothetical protein
VLEGFAHLIPHDGDEVIRRGRRDLTLVRMTPDVIYDHLTKMRLPGGAAAGDAHAARDGDAFA